MLFVDDGTGLEHDADAHPRPRSPAGARIAAASTATPTNGLAGVVAVGRWRELRGAGRRRRQPRQRLAAGHRFTTAGRGWSTTSQGELVEDSNGDLWLCIADGNPGTWRKLGGPATAGQLHLLDAPVRIYDSRPTEAPLTVPPKSPLDPATPRTIDATLNASGVPATATGLLVNATITNGAGPGFLTLWPQGAWPGTSNVNWSAAGLTVASTTVTRCGPDATFVVQSNVVVDVLFDVIGYYQ